MANVQHSISANRPRDRRPAEPKVQLPHVEPLGRIPLNFVKVYAPEHGVVLKAHRGNGDNPELYIDLEHPRPEFEQQNGPELHLGISAKFRVEPLRNSKVKPHIDAYLAESEIHRFLQSIIQANLRRDNRHQAPVGPASWPHYPPTSRESAKVGVSGQRERGGGESVTGGVFSPSSSSVLLPPARPAAAPNARRGEVRDE